MKTFLIILCGLFFISCACKNDHVKDLSTFPPSHSWIQYDKNPVKKANEDGTLVVDEKLVGFTAQAKPWIKRVEEWKIKNKIP
jgi:hypothetical protein